MKKQITHPLFHNINSAKKLSIAHPISIKNIALSLLILLFAMLAKSPHASHSHGSLISSLSAQDTQKSQVVNIYSYRQEFLIRPLLADFKKKTDIQTRVLYLNKGMLERLQSEGRNSPADVILTVDIGRFKGLKEAGLLDTLPRSLVNTVPQKYRDANNAWIGLTTRARIIYVSKDRVPATENITYASLAEKKWKGRVCMRSGYHVYNIAWIASQIAHHGSSATKKWLRAIKANLARRPQGNDRSQVKAIKEGLCDLSIGNSYYYGKMALNDENPEQKTWASAVRLVFPSQDGIGTHMNISGAAIARYAPNKQNALKLIAYLASDAAQFLYAQMNFEFPVSPHIPRPSRLPALNVSFLEDSLPLDDIITHYTEASILLDRIGFDN